MSYRHARYAITRSIRNRLSSGENRARKYARDTLYVHTLYVALYQICSRLLCVEQRGFLKVASSFTTVWETEYDKNS